jgi:hypothetical protein
VSFIAVTDKFVDPDVGTLKFAPSATGPMPDGNIQVSRNNPEPMAIEQDFVMDKICYRGHYRVDGYTLSPGQFLASDFWEIHSYPPAVTCICNLFSRTGYRCLSGMITCDKKVKSCDAGFVALKQHCDGEKVTDKFVRRPDSMFAKIDGKTFRSPTSTLKRVTTMSHDIQRFKKRRQVETVVINLSALAALLFSAWILHHFVTLALSRLIQLIP